MLRKTAGVIAGYIVMALFIFTSFSALYASLGTEGAFLPGSYTVSISWITATLILGLIAAIVGGILCVYISRSRKATMVLAGIVLILGIAMAVPVIMGNSDEEPLKREGEVAMFDAMQKAKQPHWITIVNPIIGAIGVFAGSRSRKEESLNK